MIKQTTVTKTTLHWTNGSLIDIRAYHDEAIKDLIKINFEDEEGEDVKLEFKLKEFDNLIEQMIDFRDTIKGTVKMTEDEFMGEE